MRFALERVSQPEAEPVTLSEMKIHLRCYASETQQDDQITGLIQGAREWVEEFTGRALVDQTWRLTVEQNAAFSGDFVSGYNGMIPPFSAGSSYAGRFFWIRPGELMLRKSPVLEILSFVSVATDGTETTIDPATYEIREKNSKWPRVVALSGAIWQAGTFKIVYRAGFCDLTGSPQQSMSVVPQRFKQAMKLWAEASYDRDPIMMPLLLKVAEQLIRGEVSEMRLA